MEKKHKYVFIFILLLISAFGVNATGSNHGVVDSKSEILVSLPAPQNLIVTNFNSTTISTQWDAVSGAVSYRVRAYELPANTLVQTKYTNNLNITNDNLEGNTDYRIEVTPADTGGDYSGNESSTIVQRTDFVIEIVINTFQPTNKPYVPSNYEVILTQCNSHCKVVKDNTDQFTEFQISFPSGQLSLNEVHFDTDEEDAGFLASLSDGGPQGCNVGESGYSVQLVSCENNSLMSYAKFKVFSNVSGEAVFQASDVKPGYTVYVAKCTPPKMGMPKAVAAKTPRTSVYPNPFNAELELDITNGEPVQVQIMDLSGRLWIEKTITDANTSIDTQALPNGAYMVKMVSSTEVKSIKVIKTGL